MAGITIRNPGSGRQAFVSNNGQLLTQSESLSLQHFISRYDGQSYQWQFEDTGIQSATNVVGLITNNSTTLSMVISYIRLQAVDLAGGTAIPSINAYWSLNFDETYASGGAAGTAPVNLNRQSGKAADVTVYDTNPTLAGTAVEFDRLYVSSEGQDSFSKDGAVILGAGDSMSIKLVADNTSGLAYGRVTFMMMDLSGLT